MKFDRNRPSADSTHRVAKTTSKVILFNKPYGVHSQFKKDHEDMVTLADFFTDKQLRCVGRLDADSEGLLILTDNGRLNNALASPDPRGHKHPKTYLVQVENTPSAAMLSALRQGVTLKEGKTLPAVVKVVAESELPIDLWQRNPPIRERRHISTAWLVLTIFEGKNRQVRRMTAHVGLPCLRLIRYQVAGFVVPPSVGSSQSLMLDDEALRLYGVHLSSAKPKPSTARTARIHPKRDSKSGN